MMKYNDGVTALPQLRVNGVFVGGGDAVQARCHQASSKLPPVVLLLLRKYHAAAFTHAEAHPEGCGTEGRGTSADGDQSRAQEMEDFGELDDVLQGGPVPQLNANQ